MNIAQWLNIFHTAWRNHDIEKVMSLFTDDVEYWETPHYLIRSKAELIREWQAITTQQDIQVTSKTFCSYGNKHTVIWQLRYTKNGASNESGGVYLIELKDEGLCNYFYYVGENKEIL